MTTTIRLLDEATASERIGSLALGRLCLEVTGSLASEIAQLIEGHPDLPITTVCVQSGGKLQQLWVLLSLFGARREDVRGSNDALMLLKFTWAATERDVLWVVPRTTRTVLFTH
jgi:hypothetical protein